MAYSHKHQWTCVSWKHTASYIAKKAIGEIDLILDTHSTEYTRETFNIFNAFRQTASEKYTD